MATVTEHPESLVAGPPLFITAADLLERLGDIPPDRVLLHPPPGTATEEDVSEVNESKRHICELIDGTLVEKTMGFYESVLGITLASIIGEYVRQHDLGIVAGEGGALRFALGLVFVPDVSFVSWKRLPDRKIPRKKIPHLIPDLAVEVLSESNTRKEMARKLREYLDKGVELVWYLDPELRTMTVHQPNAEPVIVPEDGVIDGGNVLPGFTLKVADIFLQAGPREE